ncbi:MAG: hypothetical protein QG578_403 [Thermodesulfobacteriota bacterium]|nr:hypothetical protein [Thermodesulfobacteriota bacterium]
MKVLTLVGTRPEIIKLCRVIHELDRYVDHILVHSGQNYDYELNEIFFKQLEIRRPDYFLDAVGATTAQTIGNVIAKTEEVLLKENPDAFLLLGDTNSCLGAISAKRRKIPVFHMEAGNRCFDQRVPEEVNRRIVDHISDINMTYTEHARRYLLAEGIKPETVIKTGSPMKEILEHYMPQIGKSEILRHLDISSGKYIVVSAHREENIDSEKNFNDIIETLKFVAEKYEYPVIVSTHPRTRKKIEKEGVNIPDPRIRFINPIGFPDYVNLQMNSFCVISDSGTITEESAILNFPAVMIRQAHERPEGMDEGTLIMCGLCKDAVVKSIDIVTSQFIRGNRTFKLVNDYDADNVSKKVLRIIMSYTDYVNRTVWYKS